MNDDFKTDRRLLNELDRGLHNLSNKVNDIDHKIYRYQSLPREIFFRFITHPVVCLILIAMILGAQTALIVLLYIKLL
jgi:hypothetical protein